MEQQYSLKRGEGLTIFEQNNMTAEDRSWWMRRIQRDIDKEKEQSRSTRMPSVPRPRRPNIPRR